MSVELAYEAGAIRLYRGDCRDLLETLPDQSIQVLLTDPPYSSGARRDSERAARGSMLRGLEDADWFSHDTMTTWGFTWFARDVFRALRRVLVPGAHLYVFTDWRMAPTVYGCLEAEGYRVNHNLVWDKVVFGMGTYWRNQHEHIVFASLGQPAEMRARNLGSVLRCKTVSPDLRIHPTEKPIPLLHRILQGAPAGRVLDLFSGSGSTLYAARMDEREAVGVELDERHCRAAVAHLTTGRAAALALSRGAL